MMSWIRTHNKDWPILVILGVSSVLNMIGITWGLPNYLDWAIDSLSPFTMLEAAHSRFSHGWFSRYPPVHLAVLAFFAAPLMGYLIVSGGLNSPSPVFPFGLSDPLATLSHLILISRIVSVVMGVSIVLLVYLTVRELFDRRSAVFSALIVTLSYPFVYYSHTANADVPYLFWALLSVHRYLRVLKYGALKDYVLFALFGTLAICTKDQAYGLFLLSPLPILWIRFRELRQNSYHQNLLKLFFDRRLILTAIVAAATFATAHNFIFNFSGFIKHVQIIVGGASKQYAEYAPTMIGRLQLFGETLLQVSDSLTLPLFVLCTVGALYCALRFPRYSLSLLFLPVSYYLTFINVVRYVPLRFVLPISIFMAFFGGKLLADIWYKAPWKRLARASIGLVFAYAAVYSIQLDTLFLRESRFAAEQWINQHFQKGALVETFTPYNLLKYQPRFPPWVRVRSSELAAGTQWQLQTGLDQGRLPNLYTGREAPDYIVLSEFWYGRFLKDERTDANRVVRDLFLGYTDYKLVATFQVPTIVPINLFTINPRIDVFAKTKERNPN
jgi:Dolichyl-phosphate-mannose-protein mannosyltransferase